MTRLSSIGSIRLLRVSAIEVKSRRPKGQESTISALNAAIEASNLAKELSSITPAKAVFGSVGVTLTTIKGTMMNQVDYVELGLACAEICTALDRGLRKLNGLSNSVCEAIRQLTTAVAEIQRSVIKQGERNTFSRHLHAKNNKEKISTWKSDLNGILRVFNIELAINTHVVSGLEHNATSTRIMVSNIHRTIVEGQGGNDSKNPLTQTSIPGESPPLSPRTSPGRDELIEKIVDLAENFTPIALIGAGGIGKTAIALAVLHHDRIKQRFGHDRRFIRCDQFPASSAHLVRRLSNVIGVGIKTPENLSPIRTVLSSKEMVIVLDNAESILDPRGTDAREIYTVVEELNQSNNICICITSRISTTPPGCKHLDVPTLSTDAVGDTFYRIYNGDAQSDLINSILEQLDFHPLSITLLATVTHQNKWDTSQSTRERAQRRTSALQTQHNESLTATIRLSLASPLFQELGSDAQALLGVIAFSHKASMRRILNGYFPPSQVEPIYSTSPAFSLLTYRTKEHYFSLILIEINPNEPSLRQTRWIASEDINFEHLLNVFMTVNANSDGVRDACISFMTHLTWHKRRLAILKPKIEGLPDDHRPKLECLFALAWLFGSVGNRTERKRLLYRALNLQRAWRSDHRVARTLELPEANRLMSLREEGIHGRKEHWGL